MKSWCMASAAKTGKVVTIEEHSVIGGLGSAVCDILSEKQPTKVMKIGINDVFGESGPALELIQKVWTGCTEHLRESKGVCKTELEKNADKAAGIVASPRLL